MLSKRQHMPRQRTVPYNLCRRQRQPDHRPLCLQAWCCQTAVKDFEEHIDHWRFCIHWLHSASYTSCSSPPPLPSRCTLVYVRARSRACVLNPSRVFNRGLAMRCLALVLIFSFNIDALFTSNSRHPHLTPSLPEAVCCSTHGSSCACPTFAAGHS